MWNAASLDLWFGTGCHVAGCDLPGRRRHGMVSARLSVSATNLKHQAEVTSKHVLPIIASSI